MAASRTVLTWFVQLHYPMICDLVSMSVSVNLTATVQMMVSLLHPAVVTRV